MMNERMAEEQIDPEPINPELEVEKYTFKSCVIKVKELYEVFYIFLQIS